MNKIITIILSFLFFISNICYAQKMTDNDIIKYLKEAKSLNKSPQEILSELKDKGVSKEYIQQIYKNRTNLNISNKPDFSSETNNNNQAYSNKENKISDAVELDSARNYMYNDTILNYDSTLINTKKNSNIFGHNIFTTSKITFEPSSNTAPPKNYKLGPGDDITITVWGDSEDIIKTTIGSDGNIFINNVGFIQLGGIELNDANKIISNQFSRIYDGINNGQSHIKLTVDNIRTIQVNIMGEVEIPGTYRLSSFSTIFNALYKAGGVTNIGSLRDIKIVRGSKTIGTSDIYNYIFTGNTDNDIKLEDEDVIIVPVYKNLVNISGNVKRPMYYEMKENETVDDLLKYSGGFTSDAYKGSITLDREGSLEKKIFTVYDNQYKKFNILNGDSLFINKIDDKYENIAEINGAVYREGSYQISDKINNLKTLIDAAGGLRGNALLSKILIQREKEDLTFENISVNLSDILSGKANDINLKTHDIVYIPNITELQENKTLSIFGEIGSPGIYNYADGTTVEDLIIKAGGLKESASIKNIKISRRIKNLGEPTFNNNISESINIDISGNYTGSQKTYLEPFDEVYIRKNPNYNNQKNVVVSVEILFEGNYPLDTKYKKLVDVINDAGGITSYGYVKGAKLIRKYTEEEKKDRENLLKLTNASSNTKDSIEVSKLDLSDFYTVSINLEKALKDRKSNYNITLKSGDIIYVPEYDNTVKIRGSVMYANTVLYIPGKRLGYYINQAGGYDLSANKKNVYIIYMNGSVERATIFSNKIVEPGCQIIVPSKAKTEATSLAEALSIANSTSSISAVLASIIHLLK